MPKNLAIVISVLWMAINIVIFTVAALKLITDEQREKLRTLQTKVYNFDFGFILHIFSRRLIRITCTVFAQKGLNVSTDQYSLHIFF